MPEARTVLGPKAFSLTRLLDAGFPVPDGFVVTAGTLARHVATRLRADSRDAVPDPDRIREGPLPAPLAVALRPALAVLRQGGATHLAVRSSAAAEDLDDASFAGQYETVLGVPADRPDAVADAIRRCWASYYALDAAVYSRSRGVDRTATGMAVCVQILVDADAAGVAFGAHPVTGETDTVVINASVGLGEAVVAGLVTPDTYLRGRAGDLERELGDKTVKVVRRAEGWTDTVPTTPEERSSYCLTDGQAHEVADLALRAGAFFGRPADIEFAFARGRLWLLQSRPITSR